MELVTEKNRRAFVQACELTPAIGAEIFAQDALFGNDQAFCNSWVLRGKAGEGLAAAGRLRSTLRIAGGQQADPEQLALFCRWIGGWECLQLPLKTAEKLLPYFPIGQAELQYGCFMIWSGENRALLKGIPQWKGQFVENQGLTACYHLLSRHYPGFEAPYDLWLCDISHRIRHGQGYLALGMEGQEAVSAAGVFALSERYGVVGPVATSRQYQGQGLGSKGVLICVRWVLEQERIPVLCCQNSAAGFYRRLGFVQQGQWGAIRLLPGALGT